MNPFSIDIQKTKAILIGVSDYHGYDEKPALNRIAPALNNISDMADMLLDEKILGLPPGNIFQVVNKRNDEIYYIINSILNDPRNIDTKTLILYYVGHGIREFPSGELYLAGNNTITDDVDVSGIRFNKIMARIKRSQVQNHVILLDACYSGMGAQGGNDKGLVEDQIDIKGSYIITSSAANEKTFFDSNSRNTDFTGGLLDVIKTGLPNRQPFVSLDEVYVELQRQIKGSAPQRKDNLDITDFRLFRNVKFDLSAVIQQEADLLYEDGKYQAAIMKYYEAYVQKASEEIKAKIDWCKRLIVEAEKWERSRKELEQKAEAEKAADLLAKHQVKKEEDHLWQITLFENTETAYHQFISVYSTGENANAARVALLALEKVRRKNTEEDDVKKAAEQTANAQQRKKAEEELWRRVVAKNTAEDYLQFITEFPLSAKVSVAQKNIEDIKVKRQQKSDEQKRAEEELDRQNAINAERRKYKKEEDELWSTAMITNTEAAYQHFLNRYPFSERYTMATRSISKLRKTEEERLEREAEAEALRQKNAEERLWKSTIAKNTEADFQKFIAEYPGSIKVGIARKAIESLRARKRSDFVAEFKQKEELEKQEALKSEQRKREEAELWKNTVARDTESAYQGFLTEFPDSQKVDYATLAIIRLKRERESAQQKQSKK